LLPAARSLLARVARLIELDELVFADRDLGHRLLALEHRIGDAGGIQLDGAHGIVVARDHVVDAIGRAVGVDDGHHRNAELLGFVKRDVLVPDVDHEQRIRERVHVLDAAETPLELVHLAPQLGGLFLATLVQRTGGGEFGDFPSRLMDWRMVLKFVSMPPSQRWFTNGCAARSASFWIASRAERLVPTNSTLPPSEITPLMNCAASAYIGCVFSRLMMWILFRSPKMKGAIFGFQKRV